MSYTSRGWTATYFESDPAHILDVWLFKDETSYEKNAKKLFGSAPDSKFGYYSSYHRALVMNIATGGGTLVHEMVHAFMDGNFPDCPPLVHRAVSETHRVVTGIHVQNGPRNRPRLV